MGRGELDGERNIQDRTAIYASQNHNIGSVKVRTKGLERLTFRILKTERKWGQFVTL